MIRSRSSRAWSATPKRVAIGDQTWAGFVLDLQAALAPGASSSARRRSSDRFACVKDADEIAALARRGRGGRPGRGRHARPAVRRAHRDRRASRARRADARARPSTRELRDRRRRRPRREPASRARIARDRRRRRGAVRFRRHDERLLLRHHADVPRRRAARRRSPTPTRCCTRRRKPRCSAARVGTPCEAVDAAARSIITAAGFGDRFIHRTGHGIGVEAHEDPYIVAGNTAPLVAGNAFSVEPGIYLAGASVCGSKTSWSRPTPAPIGSIAPTAASPSSDVKLDGGVFLLQWATGGLLFVWVTTRRREVGLGYGWLLRSVYAPMAARRRGRARDRGPRPSRAGDHLRGGGAHRRGRGRGARRLGRAREAPASAALPRAAIARRARVQRDARRAGEAADDAERRGRRRATAEGARPRARPHRAGDRHGRAARRRAVQPADRSRSPRRGCSWAPRSSAASATRCCSATGISCSRDCRATR